MWSEAVVMGETAESSADPPPMKRGVPRWIVLGWAGLERERVREARYRVVGEKGRRGRTEINFVMGIRYFCSNMDGFRATAAVVP